MTDTKPAKYRPPSAGIGRKKGALNKVTKQLKDMIIGALNDAGGQAYLTECALNPKTSSAFLSLLGKVLPSEVRASGPDGEPLGAATPIINITVAPSE